MGQHKDLSKFDEGQIVMARQLDPSKTPQLQLLWGVPSLQWSVSIESGPRKE